MPQHRTEMGMVGDILGVAAAAGTQGASVTTIMRHANLSYGVAKKKCAKLIDGGLVYVENSGPKKTFQITDKGRQFRTDWGQFRKEVAEFGLKV